MLKKTFFFILTGLAFGGNVFAQAGPDTSKNSKTYYFNKLGVETDIKDSIYYTRVMTRDPSNLKLFVVEDTYYNGKPRLRGYSLTPGPYFKGQGDFIRYYPGGGLKETATYQDGKFNGQRITYFPNGSKEFVGTYSGGIYLNSSQFFPNGKPYYTAVYDTAKKLEIVGDAYDPDGNLTASNGNGAWVQYADTFKRIFARGPIINGLKDGEWKGKMKDTSTRFDCIYSKGVLVTGTTYVGNDQVIHYTKEEIEPEFSGGMKVFYKKLASHSRYPKVAKENNVQGKVILSFVIEKDGTLTGIKVVKGIGSGCDEAAVEALKKTSDPWVPGQQYGLPVRVQYSLPLTFSLKQEDD